jgi:regulator of protease activity HflC (stomatin/prohibitin superfamily)
MGITIISSLIAIFAIAFVVKGVMIVQQSETVIIERLGKYNNTLKSGLNIIIPIIDKPRQIIWRYSSEGPMGNTIIKYIRENKIDLRETVYDFPKQNVITKDNIVTEINALIYFQIMDPVRAVYEIANLPQAIEKLTQTSLRNVIGEMDLDDTLSSRDTINSKLQEILDDATNKWGVKINRVELQDINPPMDIREAMEKQMRAERDKRAAVLEAEGIKQSEVLKAEGDRQAEINRAEGQAKAMIEVAKAEAEALKLVSDAIKEKTGDPVNYLIATKYLETLKEMTTGKDNKIIYMPYEATGVLSSVAGIKDLLVTKGK